MSHSHQETEQGCGSWSQDFSKQACGTTRIWANMFRGVYEPTGEAGGLEALG